MTHKPDQAAVHPPVLSRPQPSTARLWTYVGAAAPGVMRGESPWTYLVANCPWFDEGLESIASDMRTWPLLRWWWRWGVRGGVVLGDRNIMWQCWRWELWGTVDTRQSADWVGSGSAGCGEMAIWVGRGGAGCASGWLTSGGLGSDQWDINIGGGEGGYTEGRNTFSEPPGDLEYDNVVLPFKTK